MADDKIEVLNVNQPGHKGRVNRHKYEAMKKAIAEAFPGNASGLTQKEAIAAVKPHLPGDLFPGGETAGWWFKCVQLDLEARGAMGRTKGSPLRFFLT